MRKMLGFDGMLHAGCCWWLWLLLLLLPMNTAVFWSTALSSPNCMAAMLTARHPNRARGRQSQC
jgi:hypothetical protein